MMLHRVLTVQSQEGFRGRTAAQFVQLTTRFKSQIILERGNKKINAKSIMGVLSLAMREGDSFHIFITGVDEKQALAEICQLFESNA